MGREKLVQMPHSTTTKTTSTGPFVRTLLLALALSTTGAIAVLHAPHSLLKLLGFLVLGSMFAHFIELQHQCLHGTALKSSKANWLVGTLLGLPMLVSYSHYRLLHLQHHRFLGTAQNREFFQYKSASSITFSSLLLSAFNVKRYAVFARNAVDAWFGRAPADFDGAQAPLKARVISEYRFMSLSVAIALALAFSGHATDVAMLWFLPTVLVAEPVHLLIELPEHILCDTSVKDPFVNTRTIRGSKFSFWFTNGNNFHVEHHYRPGIFVHELPEFHKQIRSRITVYEASYPSFFLHVFSLAWRNTIRLPKASVTRRERA